MLPTYVLRILWQSADKLKVGPHCVYHLFIMLIGEFSSRLSSEKCMFGIRSRNITLLSLSDNRQVNICVYHIAIPILMSCRSSPEK